MTNTTDPTRRARWGRSRFGGPAWLLMTVSPILGLLSALALAWVFTIAREPLRPEVAVVLMTAATAPVCTGLWWLILVDRASIAGAPPATEDSIESRWVERAAAAAFFDLMIVAGFSLAVVSVLGIALPGALVLFVLVGAAAVDAGTRYAWLRSVEG